MTSRIRRIRRAGCGAWVTACLLLGVAGQANVARAQDPGDVRPTFPKKFAAIGDVEIPIWAVSNSEVRRGKPVGNTARPGEKSSLFAGAREVSVDATDELPVSDLVPSPASAVSAGGATMSASQTVRVEPAEFLRTSSGDQLRSSATTDPQNNLYVTYEDRHVELVSQAGDTTIVKGIRVLRSGDEGKTWTYFLTLGDRSDQLYGPTITYAQGFLFVAYRRASGGLTVFQKPVSGWSGARQFSPPLPAPVSRPSNNGAKWVLDARIVSDSKLYDSVGSSALYLAYVFATTTGGFGRDYRADLYVTRSQTLGTDWTEPLALVDDGRIKAFPEYRGIGMDFGGPLLEPRLHVAYAYAAPSQLEFRLTSSGDFGASYSAPVVLGTSQGYLYSIDVAAHGSAALAAVTRQGECGLSGCYADVVSWYSEDNGALWTRNRIAVNAAHSDVSHDGAGNFYAVYWKTDGTAQLEIGDGSPIIGSLPIELNAPESRGGVFDTDPGVVGFWSGEGAMATYTVSAEALEDGPFPDPFDPEYFSEIGGNRVRSVVEPDISVAPTTIDVFQADDPPVQVAPEVDPSWEYRPGRVIVAVAQDGFGKMPVDLSDLHRRAGATGVSELIELGPVAVGKSAGFAGRATTVLLAEFDTQRDVGEVLGVYRAHPDVLFAEPDYVWERHVAPNDPLYSEQWGLRNREQAVPWPEGSPVGVWGADIDAERAWDLTTGSSSVVVAVVDDGVDVAHPEFSGRILPGYDFANEDSDPTPQGADGHGTAVAGIIAAAGNNGFGVAGVAWGVAILPAKVFEQGSTTTSTIARAVVWSADQGADIINMSLGGPAYSQLMEMAVDYAHSFDVLVVSSAGNSNLDNRVTPSYPAGYRNSMSIGALSPCNTRKTSANSSLVPNGRGRDPAGMSCDEEYWWGSHYGDLDVLAPGTRIYTTDITGSDGYSDGDYLATFNGTSAAAPFVSGVAALVRSAAPELTNDEVRSVLRLAADDMGDPGWDADTGHGRLNAYRALLLAKRMETPGEILVYNRGTLPLSVAAAPDRSWLQIVSSPTSIEPGGVGGVEFSVDWSDPAFVPGLPLQAGIEIVSNDPDEQQSVVSVTAAPDVSACRPAWTVSLAATGTFGTAVSVFGEGVNASDGLDPGCGERSATAALAAFELPAGGGTSTKDIRDVSGNHEWLLTLSGSDPVELAWSPDDLPEGSFFATVGSEMPVDMRAVESLTVADPADGPVSISRSEMICVPFPARTGWVQRTIPVAVADASLEATIPRATRAYEHRGRLSSVQELEVGRGYWTFEEGPAPNNSDLDPICGRVVPPEGRMIDLAPGWNMIGTFEAPVGLPQLVTDPPGLLMDSVRTYWSGTYFAVDSLYPSVAYWVRSSGAGQLTYAEPGASAAPAFAATSHADGHHAGGPGVLTGGGGISDAAAVEIGLAIVADNGSRADLRFGLDPCASRVSDECVGEEFLPPFPPRSELIDASFIGRYAAETTDWVAAVSLNRFGTTDIRQGDAGANLTIDHFFRVQWPVGSDSISFAWNFPVGAMARLAENVDEEDGEVPRFVASMADNGNTVLTDSTVVNFRLTVTYEDVISTINVAPRAVDDLVTTLIGRPVTVFPLFNDQDADGDALTLQSFTQPRHGSAVSPREDAILYSPPAAFAGMDTLEYVARDPAGGLDTALVVVHVTQQTGNPPVSVDTEADGALRGHVFAASIRVGGPVAPIDGLMGLAIELRYDPAVLLAIPESIIPGRFLGTDLVSIDPLVDPVAGRVALSLSRRRGEQGVSGSGSVAQMSFQVLPAAVAGSTIIDVIDALAVDSIGNEIRVERVAGVIDVVEPLVVWPGLTGFDASVEATDVFPIGDCYGLSGPIRLGGVDVSWQPKEVMPWYFPARESRCTGLAAADPGTVDANGDGFIDELDLGAISSNFGLSLPAPGKTSSQLVASLDSAYVPVSPVGSEYAFDITLGTAGEPVRAVVGVAARLRLAPDVLRLKSVGGAGSLDDGDLLAFDHFDASTGEVETALVRKRGADSVDTEGPVVRVLVEVVSAMTEPAEVAVEAMFADIIGGGSVPISAKSVGISEAIVVSAGDPSELPVTLGITALYPNPVQTTATVAVDVPDAGEVRLSLFDTIGRLVAVPFSGRVVAGRYRFPVGMANLPSGTYFLRLESGGRQVAVPMIRVR